MPMGFPFKYQDEMYTCGVACLQMLSECFQLRISANEIKKLCNLRERGISLYELGHVARQLGLRSKNIMPLMGINSFQQVSNIKRIIRLRLLSE